MAVVVKDMHKISSTKQIIGYCSCGREVKYSWLHPDRVCPLCGAKLVWDFGKEGENNVKDI